MKHLVTRISLLLVALVLLIARKDHPVVFAASGTHADQADVWQLEHSYWEYVKALDVNRYKGLWHEDFVGWPSTEAMPLRKDHIADWLSSNIAEQNTLKCYRLEPAAITVIDKVAVVHYHLTERWADKSGKSEAPRTIKVSHTWLRMKDSWQIIGGMAAVVNPEPACD
jgi:ketosteroid isomerase-like protein